MISRRGMTLCLMNKVVRGSQALAVGLRPGTGAGSESVNTHLEQWYE